MKAIGNNIEIKYVRDGEEYSTNLNPAKTKENEYKLGLWVRDAAAGVGTITFYEPETKNFAALGHGIIDIDTSKLINISKGELVTSKIISIVKGENGKPGEIKGSIENGTSCGEIYENTPFGIYGKIRNTAALGINKQDTIEVANRDEIKTGEAKIISTLENGKKQEYEIKIEKIYYNNNTNNKSMLIKVTDEELIQKTGGIIQGMSGSPIIQNGKFIRSCNPCTSKRLNRRICSICRFNGKTDEDNKLNFRDRPKLANFAHPGTDPNWQILPILGLSQTGN